MRKNSKTSCAKVKHSSDGNVKLRSQTFRTTELSSELSMRYVIASQVVILPEACLVFECGASMLRFGKPVFWSSRDCSRWPASRSQAGCRYNDPDVRYSRHGQPVCKFTGTIDAAAKGSLLGVQLLNVRARRTYREVE